VRRPGHRNHERRLDVVASVDVSRPPARPGSWLSIQARDTHRSVTRLTLAGWLAAVALAVVGVPRADLHGPLHFVGIMDPLCGGTRAAYLLAHGQWAAAWSYNPVVFPLAVAAVLLVCRAVVGWSTGRWLAVHLADRRLLMLVLFVALAALEVRQQLHADLLTAPWTGH
jgi:hypothetical protein